MQGFSRIASPRHIVYNGIPAITIPKRCEVIVFVSVECDAVEGAIGGEGNAGRGAVAVQTCRGDGDGVLGLGLQVGEGDVGVAGGEGFAVADFHRVVAGARRSRQPREGHLAVGRPIHLQFHHGVAVLAVGVGSVDKLDGVLAGVLCVGIIIEYIALVVVVVDDKAGGDCGVERQLLAIEVEMLKAHGIGVDRVAPVHNRGEGAEGEGELVALVEGAVHSVVDAVLVAVAQIGQVAATVVDDGEGGVLLVFGVVVGRVGDIEGHIIGVVVAHGVETVAVVSPVVGNLHAGISAVQSQCLSVAAEAAHHGILLVDVHTGLLVGIDVAEVHAEAVTDGNVEGGSAGIDAVALHLIVVLVALAVVDIAAVGIVHRDGVGGVHLLKGAIGGHNVHVALDGIIIII